MTDFFSIDYDLAYPIPTPERMAEAYLSRIYHSLHYDNMSYLMIFYGKHRAGKSLCSVSFCHIIDPTFEPNLEARIVYSSKGLINAFKVIREQNIHGAGIIVDEAGTGDLSSQRWYEDISKIMMANLQAVGYLNPFLCFVTQNFSFINSVARKLSQGVFEVERTNKAYATVKPFWITNSPWLTGFYRRYPIFCENRNGIASNIYKLSRIKIGLPPQRIVDRYVAHSQAYKDNLLKESEEDVRMGELAKTREKMVVSGIDAIAEEVYRNAKDYKVGSRKQSGLILIDENLIRHRHNVSVADSKLIRTLVEQKEQASGIHRVADDE